MADLQTRASQGTYANGEGGEEGGLMIEVNKIIQGDALSVLRTLESESVQCVCTSPPYWALRNYSAEGQIGLEETPSAYGLVGIGDDLVGLDVNPSGFSEAHFATFPEKLIEPLILAGTSAHGACAECGSPYQRQTSVEKSPRREVVSEYAAKASTSAQGNLTTQRWDEPDIRTTTGWQKTCKCETDEVKPCIVLDPFSGAGTTALVALKHRRNFIGIELNPEYIKISEKRLQELQVKLF